MWVVGRERVVEKKTAQFYTSSGFKQEEVILLRYNFYLRIEQKDCEELILFKRKIVECQGQTPKTAFVV